MYIGAIRGTADAYTSCDSRRDEKRGELAAPVAQRSREIRWHSRALSATPERVSQPACAKGANGAAEQH